MQRNDREAADPAECDQTPERGGCVTSAQEQGDSQRGRITPSVIRKKLIDIVPHRNGVLPRETCHMPIAEKPAATTRRPSPHAPLRAMILGALSRQFGPTRIPAVDRPAKDMEGRRSPPCLRFP